VSVVLDVCSWVFLTAAAFFTLVGGVGVLRMPDLFTRLHASGVSDMLGAGFLMVGLMFQAGSGLTLVKVLLLFAFFMLTSPTAAHVLAKCALHSGERPVVGDAAERKPQRPVGAAAGGEEAPSKR